MARIISTSHSDAIQALNWIEWRRDVVLANLANVGTVGFKRFDPWSFSRVFAQGSFRQTENQFHVAIVGNGFFVLQLPDGTTAYTRYGAFDRDRLGQLVTPAGQLLDPPISVSPEAINIEINPDGIVTEQLSNGTLRQVGQIILANFVNPSGLQAILSASSPIIHHFRETAASGAPLTGNPGQHGTGSLLQGFVELSNVSARDEEYSLELLRKYEESILFGLRAAGINLP